MKFYKLNNIEKVYTSCKNCILIYSHFSSHEQYCDLLISVYNRCIHSRQDLPCFSKEMENHFLEKKAIDTYEPTDQEVVKIMENILCNQI